MLLFCFILIFAIMVIFVVAFGKDTKLKELFLGAMLSIVLGFAIVFTVADREGKAIESTVASLGYATYTSEELYSMSEKEKDECFKTVTFSGTKYWRINE